MDREKVKELRSNKKAQMGLTDLYQYVWIIVLIGVVVAVGIVILDKMKESSGLGNTSQNALNSTISALADIPEVWLGIIVVIVVMAIVISLLFRSFFQGPGRL